MTQNNYTNLPYRPCAGIFLLNQHNQVFVGARLDSSAEYWQMPQGGIDAGESPYDAAMRELKEEIGSNDAALLQEASDWIDYDLPDQLLGKVWGGKYRGQRQKWFAMRFLGRDQDINLNTPHPEFSRWQWLAVDQLQSVCVDFKRSVYHKITEEFKSHHQAIG